MSKRIHSESTFQKTCLENPKYKLWLALVPSDEKTARCILCKKDINVSAMGVSALESHATGKKHKSLMKERKQYSETFFPQKKSSERNSEKEEDNQQTLYRKKLENKNNQLRALISTLSA